MTDLDTNEATKTFLSAAKKVQATTFMKLRASERMYLVTHQPTPSRWCSCGEPVYRENARCMWCEAPARSRRRRRRRKR